MIQSKMRDLIIIKTDKLFVLIRFDFDNTENNFMNEVLLLHYLSN